MMRKIFAPALLAGLLLSLPALAFGETHEFSVDPNHSEVGFTIRHLVSTIPGRFDRYQGTVRLDPSDVEHTLAFWGSVETASVNTNNAKRDEHLRSPEFFDVAKFPEMTLRSQKVHKEGERYRVTAELTLHGVTRSTELEVAYNGVATNPFTKTPTTGLDISGTIRRKDFGMSWNKALDAGGFILGDEVHLIIHLEATVPPGSRE